MAMGIENCYDLKLLQTGFLPPQKEDWFCKTCDFDEILVQQWCCLRMLAKSGHLMVSNSNS